jgi:AcrR family transcriptional regulator
MTSVVRPHRGVSAAQRRADRRSRLVTACLDMIGESGVKSVSAEAVSARAGLIKRYFYESFSDRDALLDDLLSDFFVDVRATIIEALTPLPDSGGERAQLIAQALIGFLRDDPRRARLYVEAPGYPVLQARREQAYEVYTQLMVDTFPPADPDAPISTEERLRRSMAALLIVSGTTQVVITWLQGRIDLPVETVVGELARIILAVLQP